MKKIIKKKREDVTPDEYKKMLEELSTLKSALKREKLRADFYEESHPSQLWSISSVGRAPDF